MKMLVIDGNSILNRAFYGIRPLTTKDGQHTNAIFGFMTTFEKVLSETNPDAVAVAFYLNFLMKKSLIILRLHLIYLHRHSDIRLMTAIRQSVRVCPMSLPRR